MCIYVTLNPKDCYKELNVNIKKQGAIEDALKQAKKFNLSFILLNGNSQSISKVIMMTSRDYKMMNETYFLPFITSFKYISQEKTNPNAAYTLGTALSNFQGSLAINRIVYYLLDIPNVLLGELQYPNYPIKLWAQLLRNERIQKLFKDNIDCNKYRFLINCNKDFDLNTIIMTYKFFKSIVVETLSLLMEKQEIKTFLIEQLKHIYYIEKVNVNNLLNHDTFNPTIALKSRPFCEEKNHIVKLAKNLFIPFTKNLSGHKVTDGTVNNVNRNFTKKQKGTK